jgi:nucleotide-binding universal stress UspA family protein
MEILREQRRESMRTLFATDGSQEAMAAARLLAALPLEVDDTMTVLTVVPPEEKRDAGEPLAERHSLDGEAVVASAREILCYSAATLRSEVRHGSAAQEILRAAMEHSTDLLVVGACGLSSTARFLLGSVAERVARHASCSVLVVRPLSAVPREVILGVDDSPCSARAAEWLRRFPLPPEGEVRLVAVLPLLDSWLRSHVTVGPPLAEQVTTLAERERDEAQRRLHSLAASFIAEGKRAVTEVRSGDPALALLQVAEEERADLIVVGSHGQSAIERFLLGSVSEKVLRHAHCSVLIVR